MLGDIRDHPLYDQHIILESEGALAYFIDGGIPIDGRKLFACLSLIRPSEEVYLYPSYGGDRIHNERYRYLITRIQYALGARVTFLDHESLAFGVNDES